MAARLGNTVAVCRKSYVHPQVLALLAEEASAQALLPALPAPRKTGLRLGEREFLAFLKASA